MTCMNFHDLYFRKDQIFDLLFVNWYFVRHSLIKNLNCWKSTFCTPLYFSYPVFQLESSVQLNVTLHTTLTSFSPVQWFCLCNNSIVHHHLWKLNLLISVISNFSRPEYAFISRILSFKVCYASLLRKLFEFRRLYSWISTLSQSEVRDL